MTSFHTLLADMYASHVLNVEEWYRTSAMPGYLVFLIVEIPMLLLVLVVLSGRLRSQKTSIVFLGVMTGMLLLFVAVTFIMSGALSFIVP